jgi:ABC-2 type transport system ATP-binding protein
MAMLLEVSKVDQVFRVGFWMKRVQVLHSLDLSVPARSVYGFLGANGAGKTTLIQLIVGLRRPTAGEVRIAGIPSHLPRARARIGYLPERPYFHDHLTGERLLRYFGALSGMKDAHVRDRIGPVLAAVGMAHARHLELRKYSKGMLQRIGVAQAILHDPEFLVFDEPMSGLDPVGRKDMRELILRLAAEGRTVFFSTHVIPDVEAICDQVAVIQKGKLVGQGSLQNLLAPREHQVEIAFAGLDDPQVARLPGLQGTRRFPDGVKATVSGQAALDAAVRALTEARAQVLWVTPIRPSLESLFGEAYHG